MSEVEKRTIYLINERDISSIQVLASELRMDEEAVRQHLLELVSTGKLDGYITEDGRRFFKKDVKVQPSQKPREEDMPEFMKYDTTPGRFLALIGIIIMSMAGGILLIFPGILYYENLGVSLLFIGLIVALAGCYYIGRRKTPM